MRSSGRTVVSDELGKTFKFAYVPRRKSLRIVLEWVGEPRKHLKYDCWTASRKYNPEILKHKAGVRSICATF
jgi:hypothetical protein